MKSECYVEPKTEPTLKNWVVLGSTMACAITLSLFDIGDLQNCPCRDSDHLEGERMRVYHNPISGILNISIWQV